MRVTVWQHVDLRAEFDCCQAAVKGLQASCGCCMDANSSSMPPPPPPSSGRATKRAIRLTISPGARRPADELRMVINLARHDLLGDVEVADVGEGEKPPHCRMAARMD